MKTMRGVSVVFVASVVPEVAPALAFMGACWSNTAGVQLH